MIKTIADLEIEYARILGFTVWNERQEFINIKPTLNRLIKNPRFIAYPEYFAQQLYTRWTFSPLRGPAYVGWFKDQIEWLLTNTTGKFSLHYAGVKFELKNDLMLYKLAYG